MVELVCRFVKPVRVSRFGRWMLRDFAWQREYLPMIFHFQHFLDVVILLILLPKSIFCVAVVAVRSSSSADIGVFRRGYCKYTIQSFTL